MFAQRNPFEFPLSNQHKLYIMLFMFAIVLLISIGYRLANFAHERMLTRSVQQGKRVGMRIVAAPTPIDVQDSRTTED